VAGLSIKLCIMAGVGAELGRRRVSGYTYVLPVVQVPVHIPVFRIP
jgi:hypothetical protein